MSESGKDMEMGEREGGREWGERVEREGWMGTRVDACAGRWVCWRGRRGQEDEGGSEGGPARERK